MPKRRKQKKNKRSRGGRRGGVAATASADTKVSNASAVVNIPGRITGGFPDTSRIRLAYAETVQGGAVATLSQVWTGNGPFDPNVTGTGAQPVNYDDWSLMYNRVRPLGSSITCTFSPNASTVNVNCIVTPRHTTTSVVSGVTAFDSASANAYAKSVLMSSNPNTVTIGHSMSTQKFLGQPVRGSDLLQTVISSNPSHLWYWHTSMTAVDGISSNTRMDLRVVIQYELEFFDRLETGVDMLERRIAELKEAKAKRVRTLDDQKDDSYLLVARDSRPALRKIASAR